MPDPANPQSWNRYSYVHNNPINFNDPTGHCAERGSSQEADECWDYLENEFCNGLDCGDEGWQSWVIAGKGTIRPNDLYDMNITSEWETEELRLLHKSIVIARNTLNQAGVRNWKEAFGGVRFMRSGDGNAIAEFRSGSNTINLTDDLYWDPENFIPVFGALHELAHSMQSQIKTKGSYFGDRRIPLEPATCWSNQNCTSANEISADAFAVHAIVSNPTTVDKSSMMKVLPPSNFNYDKIGEISSEVQKMLNVYIGQ